MRKAGARKALAREEPGRRRRVRHRPRHGRALLRVIHRIDVCAVLTRAPPFVHVSSMSINRESAADTGPNPERARDASAARAEAAEDAQMLRDLAQIGMRLARLVEVNAEAKMAENPASDLGRADQMFARVSRSVRQTLAIKAKLAEMLEKRIAAIWKEDQEQEAEAARKRSRKARVQRAITETIESQAGPSDRENLLSDLCERLLEPDIEADLASRSIGELVAGICDDLGIKPDRKVWKDKGWYLTENWHSRLPEPEPGPPAAEIPWKQRIAPMLAMIEATTCPPEGPFLPSGTPNPWWKGWPDDRDPYGPEPDDEESGPDSPESDTS
jgi:hypothetical protein